MSFSTLTRYLRLKIRTDLSLPASENLARLDALGNSFNVGETDDLTVNSRGNIVLKPEATAVGGTGSGGEVHIGTSAQPVAVKFFASAFSVEGGAGSLVTEEGAATLTNKSISGLNNLLSNIGYASLNLAGSIKNSDIASDASIADSKLATISSAGKVNFSSLTGSPDGVVFPSYSGNSSKYLRLNSSGDGLEWAELSIPAGYTDADADARADARIAAVKGEANGLASLGSDGKLLTSQLPPLAITSTNVVASEAAMLALSAEEGDVAIRTDNGKTYILASSNPTSLASWKEVTAGGAVTSVNGQSGNVSLSTTDVSEGNNQYFTAARAKAATVSNNSLIDAADVAMSSSLTRSHVIGQISALKGVTKVSWSSSNTCTVTTGWATQDVFFYIFDYATYEQIIPASITWSGDNNTATLGLPSGQVAGNWRVIASRL